MPNRAAWDPPPRHRPRHPRTPSTRACWPQCNRLADLCQAQDGDSADASAQEQQDRDFDAAFDDLKALAREHFQTEAALLAGDPERLEDHSSECDEFDYLVGNIVTADNFSRLELQRFLTLWCVGHVAGSAADWREGLAGDKPA